MRRDIIKKELVLQQDIKDCGAASMLSIIKYYGGYINLEKLRELTNTNKKGTTAFHIKEAFIKLGFYCSVKRLEDIENYSLKKPVIAHVITEQKHHHFIVIYKINIKKNKVTIMDPGVGFKKITLEEFKNIWSKVVIESYPIKKIPVYNKEKSVISFFYKILKENKKKLIFIGIFSILVTTLNIISSFYFKFIIDSNLKNLNQFYLISKLFLTIILIKVIFDYLRNFLIIKINFEIDKNLFLDAFNHIIFLPYSYYKNRTIGEIISRINDLNSIKEIVNRVIVALFVDVIFVFLVTIILYHLNIELFLITLITCCSYILIIIIFSKTFQNKIKENIKKSATLNSLMIETINSYETIKGQMLEKESFEKIRNKYNDYLKKQKRISQLYNIQSTLKNVIVTIGQFSILFFGSKLVIEKSLTIGTLIMFNYLFLYFLEPLKNLSDLEPSLRHSYIAIKRILELYEIRKEQFPPSNKTINSISFNELEFSYNGIDKVFGNFNFDISKGDKILISGESGIGKSTLVKLLMKYYESNKNQIKIDNNCLTDYNLTDIRNNISYISQNEILFNDTIYNNICMNRKIKDNCLKKIYNITSLNKIFNRYNLNDSFVIEENGANLSGGERQRIILSRGLVKEANIYIIDEATSQLDLESERKIYKKIIDNYQEKTIIVISHRLDNKDLFNKKIRIEREA